MCERVVCLLGSAGFVGDGSCVFGPVPLRQHSAGLSALSQRPVPGNGPVRNDSWRGERLLCRDHRTHRRFTSKNEVMMRTVQGDTSHGCTQTAAMKAPLQVPDQPHEGKLLKAAVGHLNKHKVNPQAAPTKPTAQEQFDLSTSSPCLCSLSPQLFFLKMSLQCSVAWGQSAPPGSRRWSWSSVCIQGVFTRFVLHTVIGQGWAGWRGLCSVCTSSDRHSVRDSSWLLQKHKEESAEPGRMAGRVTASAKSHSSKSYLLQL